VTAAPPRPLAGRRIVVTRRPEQSARLCVRLEELGATVVELPLIEVAPPAEIAPLDAALRRLDGYDWVLFTSANAVRSVSERMTDLGLEERTLTSRKIASIGPSTTRALRESFPGVAVSVEAANHDAESLLKELATGARGRRFLLPSSDRARDLLPGGLREEGAEVDVVVAYRTVAPADLRERVLAGLRGGADLVTFASPSAVENFAAAAAEVVPRTRAAVMGPVTERACRAAGIEVRVVAEPSTAEGLAAAIERHFLPRERTPR
jgi:uroporphyrinogen III methyltransferase/synthase